MIWIIGGTSDANKIALALKDAGFNIMISTTTDYGKTIAEDVGIPVYCGRLDRFEFVHVFQEKSVETVIDASHPYAAEVSKNAIDACAEVNIEYVRFERPHFVVNNAKYYRGYNELITQLKETDGAILVTTGSNNVHLFTEIKNRSIVRILPVEDSLKKCIEAGFSPANIIASKGIFRKETNIAIMQEYGIKHLVTKDSGESGGMSSKIEAAQEIGVQIHILQRPSISYPLVFDNYDSIINQLKLK